MSGLDSELVKRAREGDSGAFEELVRIHQNKVYSIALRMSGNREDALDISQETFLRAWRALPNFKADSKFSTWLYRIVMNISTDRFRKTRHEDSIPLTDPESEKDFDIPDESQSPDRQLEQAELADSLRRAVDELQPEWREVFILREISDMSYSEISEALGIEEGTVKSRLFRARRALQESLKKSGNIPSVVSSKDMKGGDRHG